MELSLIVGVGIFSFLLCYFAFQLDEKHNLLRVLSLFFFVFSLILIPKVAVDYNDNCALKLNSTYIHNVYANNLSAGSPHWDGDELGGQNAQDLGAVYLVHSLTNHTYSYICEDNAKTTDTAFYKLTIGFIISFSIYVLVYLSYFVLVLAKNSIGKK